MNELAINPLEIEKYIEKLSDDEPELLKKLRKETEEKSNAANMLSGWHQGRFLSIFSKIIQPKNILEIGTFTGYATLCLAEGLTENGQIVTLDVDERMPIFYQKYFDESPLKSKIKPLITQAITFIEQDNTAWDLVFLDADKINYLNYYNLLIPQMKSGSVILADNVLWKGRVTNDVKEFDKKTKALHEFNEAIKNDKRVNVSILPMRDGVSIIRKK